MNRPWPDWMPPALARWFSHNFAGATQIQQMAWRRTFRGDNVLILAPTGSGKTLSAFFSVLARIGARAATEGLPNACLAVYVSPLRALGRDIFRNLETPLAELNASLPPGRQIRMEVRTGDTPDAARSRMARKRPHLLLTTPESLSSLLSQVSWQSRTGETPGKRRAGRFDDGFVCETVIVDEIHSFAENKRGSLLALTLERLELRSGGHLQRIGLSATAQPAEAVARLLCGRRRCEIVTDSVRRMHRIEISASDKLPAAGFDPARIAITVADAIEASRVTLAFTSTRSAAERLGFALHLLLPRYAEQIAVHHSSVERGRRDEIEQRLARGEMKAVVCSTSLELGVDYADVDQVLLVGTPRGVSRALQRLGRSGHRVGGVAFGRVVPLSLPDLLEAIAMRQAVQAGALEDLRVPEAPLDVLAQVILGMAVERPWPIREAFDLIRRAGPYLDLPEFEFRNALEYLAGGGEVLARYGKIVVEDGVFRVISKKTARDYFQAIGTISEDYRVKVVSKGNRALGEVEEHFVAGLRPGEAFLIGGRVVEIDALQGGTAVVKPSKSDQVQTPLWLGGKMPLSARMAEEELRLRRELRAAWARGLRQGGVAEARRAVEQSLREVFCTDSKLAEMVAAFVERQNQAAPVPVDTPVQIERVNRGRTQLLMVHSVSGRAVNQSLAWVAAFRLGAGESVLSNSNDHGHLLVFHSKVDTAPERLREAYNPRGFLNDLEIVLRTTEALGRKFRAVAETGQLMPRRSATGTYSGKFAMWNGSLLYQTLMTYEPEHLLVREAVREVFEDTLDAPRAYAEAERIYRSEWESFEHPRPSPFALPLFAAFNRDVLLAQDSHKAFDDFAAGIYAEWQ